MIASPASEIARLRDRDAVLSCGGLEWPQFWSRVCARLRQDGYRPNTLRVYRQVLRGLRDFLGQRYGLRRPEGVGPSAARAYLDFLRSQNVSWSWTATGIGVLRNVFDRLCGLELTRQMVTPRRKWPLPETLSARELRLLFEALPDPRDRLLVALLAGCGLRVSEACRIRWCDFSAGDGTLRIDDPAGLRSRTVPVPSGLLSLFAGLVAVSRATDPMLCGRPPARQPADCRPGAAPTQSRALSVRQAERVIQAGAQRAGILKRVTPMVLRHTYGFRRLLAGDNPVAVQKSLGHRSLETTLRYQACLPPKAASPADPEPPELALRQLVGVLGRLSQTIDSMPRSALAAGP